MRNYSVQNRKLLNVGAACARSTEEVEVETNNKTKCLLMSACVCVCVGRASRWCRRTSHFFNFHSQPISIRFAWIARAFQNDFYLRPAIRSAIDDDVESMDLCAMRSHRLLLPFFGASWINAGNANLVFGTHFVHRIKFFRLNSEQWTMNRTIRTIGCLLVIGNVWNGFFDLPLRNLFAVIENNRFRFVVLALLRHGFTVAIVRCV